MIKEFLETKDQWDGYITGNAGTGKTTSLREYVQYCMDNGISYVVCAYTHKAKNVLISKLPEGATVSTLHKFLKKRPAVNIEATKLTELRLNIQTDVPNRPHILFIDEYSMIGEKDFADIRALQDPEYTGQPVTKVIWIGDPKQLPPVGDNDPKITPKGKFHIHLTKIHRNDNPLQKPIQETLAMMESRQLHYLNPVEGYFERSKDLVEEYKNLKTKDKALLCYTNRAVQQYNIDIEGRENFKEGDLVFSPNTNQVYRVFEGCALLDIHYIDIYYDSPLFMGSKYRTLEHLIKLSEDTEIDFVIVHDEEGEEYIYAHVFGHYNYKCLKEKYEREAIESNKVIEAKYKGYKASGWAKANPQDPLARKRALAWRNYMTFKDCVICLDFNHAMTVHKSQGSTFNTVFIDTDNLYLADTDMYLRLMYVAISRASNKVVTN